LASSRHLRRLKELSLIGNNISDNAQALLRERFGDRVSL